MESPEEAAWIKGYFDNTFDWFVDSPYLDQQWVDQETGIYELMKESGVVDADTEDPEMVVVSPQA